MERLVAKHASELALSDQYVGDERTFVKGICSFALTQATLLKTISTEAERINEEFL
jgi:hypothetical protein